MTSTVCTGAGYGPVTLTFDSLTLDGLRHAADPDGDVAVFAYAPNAGHELDAWHEEKLCEHLGEHVSWGRHRNFLTPLRMAYVPADDTEGLTLALEFLQHLEDYPIWDDDGWAMREYECAYGIAAEAAQREDLDPETVWARIMDEPEPYFTDNCGVTVPSLEDVLSSLREGVAS